MRDEEESGRRMWMVLVLLLAATSPADLETVYPAATAKLVLLTPADDNLTTVVVQAAIDEAASSTNAGQPFTLHHVTWPRDFPISPVVMIQKVYASTTVDTAMIIAVDSPCLSTQALRSMYPRFCIPQALRTDAHCDVTSFQGGVNMAVHIQHVISYVLDELKEEGMDTFVFFLDERAGVTVKDSLPPLLYSDRITLLDADAMLDVTSDAYTQIEAQRSFYRLFVAVLSAATISILDAARKLEIISAVQSWVIINMDMDLALIRKYLKFGDNVVIIDARGKFQKPDLPASLEILQNQTVLDPSVADLYHVVRVLLPVAMARLTTNGRRSACFINETTRKPFYLREAILRLRGMTSLAVWTTPFDPSVKLAGYINPYATTVSKFPTRLMKRFSGFHGHVFRISTVPNKLFQILQADGTFSGLAFDVLRQLAGTFNFTFTISRPPDGLWGAEDANGTWVGMIGMVMRKEVDFAVGSFTVTAGRESVIDFTVPYWHASTGMLMRTRSGPDHLLVYLSPFKYTVWVCIVAVLPISTIAMWFIFNWAPKERIPRPARSESNGTIHREPITDKDTSGMAEGRYEDGDSPQGFLVLLLMTFGIQCQQTATWLPGRGSGRIALGFLWLFSLVLAATYTGNLIAFLAVPRIEVPIDTLKALARQNDFSVGLVHGQALYNVLKSAPSGVYRDIWRKVSASSDNTVSSLAEGFERLLVGDFIFLDDTKNLVALQAELADKGDCAVHIARQKFYFSGYAFPLQPNSPYLHIFNQGIMKMIESGLVEQWMRKYWPDVVGRCGSGGTRSINPVSMSDTVGIFYLLVIGLGAATLVFGLEWLVSKHRERQMGRDRDRPT